MGDAITMVGRASRCDYSASAPEGLPHALDKAREGHESYVRNPTAAELGGSME
jgi:hypothetical protein